MSLVIWSDEILKEVGDKEEWVFIKVGNYSLPIIGIEDSQNVGWYEIRFSFDPYYLHPTLTTSYLKANLPKGVMVMLQEGGHAGKSYPINKVYTSSFDGYLILKCDNPDSEYWEELEKWSKAKSE